MTTAQTTKAPEGKPQDFVYAGRRRGQKNPLVDLLILLNPDGSLGRQCLYKADRVRRVVGGIYTGTRFSEDTAHGLNVAKWTGKKYAARAMVAKWEAEEEAHLIEYKMRKLEADAKKLGEIEKLTEPLRRLLHELRSRGDWDGHAALSAAITRSLQRPLRGGEAA